MKKFLSVAALVSSSPLVAQQVADSSKVLNEVVVSATKSEVKASATGKVVVTISRADIERAGARDLTQVLAEQGGLFINGAWSNPGKDKSVYIRGARVDHSLITIDGVPVYDATGIGSNFDLRLIPIERVERIEILKGSQGTLYGSDAIAGVINIITRKAGPGTVQGSALLSYGSFNTLRTAASVNGRNGIIDYNVGYNYFNTKGISEAATPEGSKEFAPNGYTQHGADASIGFQLTPKVHLQPYVRYTTNSGNLDAGYHADALDFTYEQKNLQPGLRGTFTLGKGTLRALYNYNRIERSYEDDSTQTPNLFNTYSSSSFTALEHFGELFYTLPLRNVKLTFGSDYRASSMKQENISISQWGNSKTELGTDSLQQRQISAYANALWTPFQGFSLEAGARYNNHSRYGSNGAWNLNPSYLWNNSVKLFANISSGYRTPSLYQLFSEYGNKDLKAEQSMNYEGGIQVLSGDGAASLRVTYFNRDVKDLIVFFTDPTTFQSNYINRDRQKDHGIEIDGKVQFSKHVFGKLFYGYADGEVTTKFGSRDTTVFNLYRRPKQNVALSLGVTFGGFTASAQLNAVGNVQDQYFDNSSFTVKTVTLKNYALLNLYAEYAVQRTGLRIFVDARNVTDAKYQEIYGYGTPGFNAYGGVRYQF
ncbi:TonB-dependent receptor plug domain-containing protein [Flaviaesturariibacter amylovorans]|uniref:TonB-dependent receptor n=1 Tax=Flaviaesturariibacter amylovorans TaxID=1084520 RepID=A0ABP8GDE5_9BACT